MQQALLPTEPLLKFDPKTSFTILSKGHVVHLPFEEITHVTKQGGETVIHTRSSKLPTYHSLQEILNDLPVNDFFRVHKSQVVALRFIQGYTHSHVIIKGTLIPMTNYYRCLLKRQLAAILTKHYEVILHEPTGRKLISANANRPGALPEKRTGQPC